MEAMGRPNLASRATRRSSSRQLQSVYGTFKTVKAALVISPPKSFQPWNLFPPQAGAPWGRWGGRTWQRAPNAAPPRTSPAGSCHPPPPPAHHPTIQKRPKMHLSDGPRDMVGTVCLGLWAKGERERESGRHQKRVHGLLGIQPRVRRRKLKVTPAILHGVASPEASSSERTTGSYRGSSPVREHPPPLRSP